MQKEIIDFIAASVGPDVAQNYSKSFELFDKLNVPDYITPFEEYYNLVDNYDTEYVLAQMQDIAENMLESLLNQHGIFVSEVASIVSMNEIIEAVTMIDGNEDTLRPLLICATESSDEEKIADILSINSAIPTEEYMLLIDRVNPALIRRIVEIFIQKEQHAIEASEIDGVTSKSATLLKLYADANLKSMMKECKVSVLLPRLRGGLKFNFDFHFYFQLLWEEISMLNNAEIARDMIGLCLVSSDKSEKVIDTIKETIGKYVSDLDDIGKILDSAIKQFLLAKQDNGVKAIEV